jgi:hypothetical protein
LAVERGWLKENFISPYGIHVASNKKVFLAPTLKLCDSSQLGSFGEPKRFRQELRTCRDATNGRPFGVNLTISSRFTDHANVFAGL